MNRISLLMLLAVTTVCPAIDPPADIYTNKKFILKADDVVISVTDKAGKTTEIGTTGKLVMVTATRTEGEKVYVGYKGENAWLAKDKVVLASEAVDYFSTALKDKPNDVSALVRRGTAQLLAGKYDLALEDLNAAVKQDPKSAAALSYRGRVWNAKREYDKAIADYDSAAKLDPKWFVPANNQGLTLLSLNKNEEAVAFFNAAIKLNPNWPLAFDDRGWAYWQTGRPDQAKADFTEALRLDPSYEQARRNRIGLNLELELKIEALHDADELIRQYPTKASSFSTRAFVNKSCRSYVNAIADYEQCLKIDPSFGIALSQLAELLACTPDDKLRNGKRAVELAKKYISTVKEIYWWDDALMAKTYAEAGEFDKAIMHQVRAIKALEGNAQGSNSLNECKNDLTLYEARKASRLPK